MNPSRRIWVTAALASALALGGCFGGDDDDTPVAGSSQEVPDSAGASTAAFVAFILALNQSDESSEPSVIKDSFVVPPDDAGDPQPLT